MGPAIICPSTSLTTSHSSKHPTLIRLSLDFLHHHNTTVSSINRNVLTTALPRQPSHKLIQLISSSITRRVLKSIATLIAPTSINRCTAPRPTRQATLLDLAILTSRINSSFSHGSMTQEHRTTASIQVIAVVLSRGLCMHSNNHFMFRHVRFHLSLVIKKAPTTQRMHPQTRSDELRILYGDR